ncbi:MAG: MBL fold metallo-hydrolase [Spirochaetia bacterium]
MFSLSLFTCGQSHEGEVQIKFTLPAQTEIIAAEGERVLLDVSGGNEKNLTSPVTENDILVYSNAGFDLCDKELSDKFGLRKLFCKAGSFNKNGIHVTTIPSVRSENEQLKEVNSSNYIILVEVDGLRICHLGNIGQGNFTKEQLALLGKIDICIAPFVNNFSNMNMSNKKGFVLIDELKPKIVIPCYYNEKSVEYAMNKYPVFSTDGELKYFSPKNIPQNTSFILMDDMAYIYKDEYKLKSF